MAIKTRARLNHRAQALFVIAAGVSVRSWTIKTLEDFKAVQGQFVDSLIQGLSTSPVQIDQRRPSRNSLTNRKLHALIGDIRKQAVITLQGAKIPLSCYEPDVVKAFMVRWFDLDMTEAKEPLRKSGKTVNCPRTGQPMYVRPSTTEFSQKEACQFVEWLYSFGVDHGVKFSEPALRAYEEYKELNSAT